MEKAAATRPLVQLLERVHCTATRLTSGSSSAQEQAEYAAAVQCVEACVLRLSADEWGCLVASGVVSELLALAVEGVVGLQLSFVAAQSWVSAVDVLLARTTPSFDASHHVARLWAVAKRLAKESSCGAALQAVLTLLRVFLCRLSATVDCIPRQHLPHPVRTASIGPRLAALELVPYLVLRAPQQHMDNEHKKCAAGGGVLPQRRPVILTSWLKYLCKAVNCPAPVVRDKAVEVISILLKKGFALEATQTTAMIEMMLQLAGCSKCSSKLQNHAGVVIGCLLAAAQRGTDWSYFAAADAANSARTIGLLFRPCTVTHVMQCMLSVAIGELLLQTAPVECIGNVLARLFELLQPLPNDARMYMPTIVSKAVKLWASRMGSDMPRVALVKGLTRFLVDSCNKVATHTALVCLVHVVPMTVVADEYASQLWAQLLQIPARRFSLMRATSEVMTRVADRSETCSRALLLALYISSEELAFEKSLSLFVALHAKALLAMPAKFLGRMSVLETLLTLVTSLSIEAPPPEFGVTFLRRVEYFNGIALVLLENQRDRLSPAILKTIKVSVRVFLSLLVSNVLSASVYARAASSTCALLVLLGTSDIELRLVIALVEAIDAVEISCKLLGLSVRAAAYKLLKNATWFADSKDVSRRTVLARALADVAEANRDGVPCALETAAEADDKENNENLIDVELIKLLDPSQEFLQKYHVPFLQKTHKGQAYTTQCAVALIVSFCTGSASEANAQLVLDRLREWRDRTDWDQATTTWNTLCCLNGIFASCGSDGRCGGNGDDSDAAWMLEAATEWFSFVELHWLSCGVWAVRLAAAKLLARLVAITERRDAFTCAVVKRCYANADHNILSGIMLALGEMHASGGSVAAPMATSLFLSVLKQHGVCGEATVLVATALAAMIRMAEPYAELVASVIFTVFGTQLLTPLTSTATARMVTSLDSSVLTLLLELCSLLLKQLRSMKSTIFSVSVRCILSAALSCRNLSEETVPAMLNIVNSIIDHYVDPMVDVSLAENACVPFVFPNILLCGVFDVLKNDFCKSDLILRAAAKTLTACWRITDSNGAPRESLLRLALKIDAAASSETRDVWIGLADDILRYVDCRHIELCQQEMELILQGKPARCVDVEEEIEHGAVEIGGFGGEEEWLSLPAKKINDIGGVGVSKKKNRDMVMSGEEEEEEKKKVVAAGIASKLAVLLLLTNLIRYPERYAKICDKVLERHFDLLFRLVSMAEVVPNFVKPAVDALLVIMKKYGSAVKGTAGPFLLQWKVMLVNGMRSLIQHSSFCFEESCLLAETFLECNLADESSVRRVIQALETLLRQLEGCDDVNDVVGHCGCGRVVLALSICRARAAAENWRQAEECAVGAIVSPSGQVAIALLCDQLLTSVAVSHGFEPTQYMIPTPLDYCRCATPTAVINVLNDICGNVSALGPTLRHAAGCLLPLLLCTPGVPLQFMRCIVPMLSTMHQEIIIDTCFGFLGNEGAEALSDEDATEVFEVLAATTVEKNGSHVESLLTTMAVKCRSCVGSLAALRLAVGGASCSVKCVNEILQRLHVDMLLVGGEPTSTTAAYIRNISTAEQKAIALTSTCGFLLLLRLTGAASEQSKLLLTESKALAGCTLPRLAEALALATDPLALLKHVFPNIHENITLCCTVVALCSSPQGQELRRKWAPCVQHALLSIIHVETLQQCEHGHVVLERISFFIRSMLLLLFSFTPSSPSSSLLSANAGVPACAVRSSYPDACAALTRWLMREYVDELKSVIRLLEKREAAALRDLMQLEGDNSVPCVSSADNEAELQKTSATTKVKLESLSINVASFI